GLASPAPGLPLVPAFGGGLGLVADLRAPLARDAPLALGFALLSVILRLFFLDVYQVAPGVHPGTAHSKPSHPVRARASPGRGDSGALPCRCSVTRPASSRTRRCCEAANIRKRLLTCQAELSLAKGIGRVGPTL